MTDVALAEYATGTLNGSGAGTIRVGPRAHGVVWRPKIASILMSGSTPSGLATVYVYTGPRASQEYFTDATYDVNNAATDSVGGTELRLGQYVWAVWTGGNALATVTLTLTGTAQVP